MLRSPITITPAGTEPVTLEMAREFVGAAAGDIDVQLAASIAMARGTIERRCGIRVARETVEVIADSFADLRALNVAPVAQVVSIELRGPDGVEMVIDPSIYVLDGDDPLSPCILDAPAKHWPDGDGAPRSVRARLLVGFGDGMPLPGELLWAMLELVRCGVDDREARIDHWLVNWQRFG